MKYLFLFLLCLSCSDDNFRKVEKLETFRVLGVYAANPEVAPGATTTVQVLVSDVNGTDAVVNGTYEACIDPGISRGAPVTCDLDPAKITGPYNITFASLTPNATLRTGLAGTLSVTVPATILSGRSATESFNGVGYIVIFRFTVGGTEQVSFKRIVAVSGRALNTNPTGSATFLNGNPLATAPVDGDQLSVTTSAPETFDVINVDGSVETKTEEFEVAWYTSVGKFDKPKAFASESVEYQGETKTPSLILSIIRDERGGLDFVKTTF